MRWLLYFLKEMALYSGLIADVNLTELKRLVVGNWE